MNILVTVLNWGLGHAARSIPIIHALTALNHRVIIASDGGALQLLKVEFPDLEYRPLPGYEIRYGRSMTWSMLSQSRKILRTRKAEHSVVQGIVADKNINLIISDQRYGCYHEDVKNVFITHQLHLPLKGAQKAVGQRLHDQWLANFQQIWIPDRESQPRLAGAMSAVHPTINSRYLGIISRFKNTPITHPKSGVSTEFLAVLSGPEPNRSRLEKIILEQFAELNTSCTLVRGVTEGPVNKSSVTEDQTIIYNYCDGDTLVNLMRGADHIITRSGYTTLMDLAALQKSAILIPTEGQPEQELLARHCEDHNWSSAQDNKRFDLELIKREKMIPWPEASSAQKLKETIADLLKYQL